MNSNVVFHQGKTKQILGIPPQIVQVRFSDYVTVGDDEVRVSVPGKGTASCATAINCFELLRRNGIPISYIAACKGETDSFMARYTRMAPLKIVCRGIATGSYIKRNPETAEGMIFDAPIVEFFLKDDASHDPLIWKGIGLYKPKEPLSKDSYLGYLSSSDTRFTDLWTIPRPDGLQQILWEGEKLARDVFEVLAFSWEKEGFSLVDLKIEVGVDPWTGQIMVSDGITPDEWRLWKGGDPNQSYDKDPFRKAKDRNDPRVHQLLLDRYGKVADISARFV
jgi:phosphoribosylaminoimidazole-succinocarboxamide synthase